MKPNIVWNWVCFSFNPASGSCRKHFGHAFSRSLSAQISCAGSVIKVWNALVAPATDVMTSTLSQPHHCLLSFKVQIDNVRELGLLPPRFSLSLWLQNLPLISDAEVSYCDFLPWSPATKFGCWPIHCFQQHICCTRGMQTRLEVSGGSFYFICKWSVYRQRKEHTRNISF
jgi:hypothetical protein